MCTAWKATLDIISAFLYMHTLSSCFIANCQPDLTQQITNIWYLYLCNLSQLDFFDSIFSSIDGGRNVPNFLTLRTLSTVSQFCFQFCFLFTRQTGLWFMSNLLGIVPLLCTIYPPSSPPPIMKWLQLTGTIRPNKTFSRTYQLSNVRRHHSNSTV